MINSNNLTWQWSHQWPGCIEPIGFPKNVRACITSRHAFNAKGDANFSLSIDEAPELVHARRFQLSQKLRVPIYWLSRQMHGTRVANLSNVPGETITQHSLYEYIVTEPADAQWTNQKGIAIEVLTADCLPVLFANQSATVVATAHAGWRGLHSGVLEATLSAMPAHPSELIAWIGPGIGPTAFQVGQDVYEAFCNNLPEASQAFTPDPTHSGKWLANLPHLAEQRLKQAGVTRILQSSLCTHQDSEKWFSYRCEPQAGRFASLIWIESN